MFAFWLYGWAAVASLYIPASPRSVPQSISTRLVRVNRCCPRAASSVTAWPEWATASPAAARLIPSWQSNSPPGVSATQLT
jgi:hypothetical protein